MSVADEFLSECTFSHVDCLDFRVLQTRQPRDAALPVPPWPAERHSCDFCYTFAAVMSRCGACERWLGVSHCECAERSCQQTSPWPIGGRRFVVRDNADKKIRCRWCAAGEAAPISCGRSMGLLRRVVFVLEPTPSSAWRFHVAQRLLDAMLENADLGTILLYSFECADDDEWARAMRRISAFAASPRLYLPANCRFYDDDEAPRISVLFTTHSMFRRRANEPVRLESRGSGVGQTFAQWIDQVDKHVFAADKPEMTIDEFYLLSCNVFPEGAVGAANARRLSALADKHSVDVMACDGDSVMMLQLGPIAAEILASTFGSRAPLTASPIRRFQPQAEAIRIEPLPARIALVSVHATQVDELVQMLTQPAAVLDEAPLAHDRAILLSGGNDETYNRDVLLRLWPFRGAEAAVKGSAATYATLFDVAAAVAGLQERHKTHLATMADWIHESFAPDVSLSRILRNLSFVSARLARVGMLERSSDEWSLERAIRCGLIVPPTITFLRDTLDTDVFDAALIALQQTWQHMADERQRRAIVIEQPRKRKKESKR